MLIELNRWELLKAKLATLFMSEAVVNAEQDKETTEKKEETDKNKAKDKPKKRPKFGKETPRPSDVDPG